MADGRKNNGGARPGAGRKPKADEQALIEKLSPYDDLWLEGIVRNMHNDEAWAFRQFSNRRWGKPKEHKEVDMSLTSLTLKDMEGLTHQERLEALKQMGI